MTNKFTTTLLAVSLALIVSAAALADGAAPSCAVCNMKVDAKHHVQYRYVLESGEKASIGSLSCAKSYWSDHKDVKMTFEATDFMSGEWKKADDGHFLVGSKLKVGNGMDKTSVLFFADAAQATKAKAANGGIIVELPDALKHADEGGRGLGKHQH